MDVHATTSIVSINLKPPHLQMLKFLIPYYFKDRFSLTEHKEADVQIIEINSDDASHKINKYKKEYPKTFFIIISDANTVDDNFFVIAPPISPKKISDALYYVSDKLTALENKKTKADEAKKERDKPAVLENKKTKADEAKKEKDKPAVLENKKTKANEAKKEKDKQPTLKIKQKSTEKQKRGEALEKKYNFYLDLDDYVENIKFDELNDSNSPKITKGVKDKEKSELEAYLENTLEEDSHKDTKKLIGIDKDNLSFMSSRPNIDLDKADYISKITYNPEDYLQGSLVKLYNSTTFNTLLTSYCVITYQAENHTAHINVNNRTLQSVASIKTLSTHYSLVNIDELKNDNKTQWEDADIILWKVTVWASRGRLPLESHDIEQPFTLMNWPNFTRLMMTPYAMEITALWVDKPINLRNTITSLNIPQRYIFSLYSAAVSLNTIVFEKNEEINKKEGNKKTSSIATKSSQNKKTKQKNVFSKLLTFFKTDNIKNI
jgi:hypothetical protein